MKKRTVVSIILGTVLLFLWNVISWMVLPFHSNTLNNIPETAIETEVLKAKMPKSGVYHYPGLPTDNSKEALSKVKSKLNSGPRITMMVYKNGPTKLFESKTFLFSLLTNFLTVAFVFFVISKLKEPKDILITTVGIGLIASLISDIGLWNWFMFPLDYTIVNVLDKLISFALLGLLFSRYTFKTKQHA